MMSCLFFSCQKIPEELPDKKKTLRAGVHSFALKRNFGAYSFWKKCTEALKMWYDLDRFWQEIQDISVKERNLNFAAVVKIMQAWRDARGNKG